MSLREQIAAVIVENRAVQNWENPRPADYELADAIIAAMPGMVPDLVWSGSDKAPTSSGAIFDYILAHDFDGWRYIAAKDRQMADIAKLPVKDLATAIAAANAHNRAAVCKAMGL